MNHRPANAAAPPVARLVLLGASNLRLGLATLLRHALAKFDGPVDVVVAHGFGRSYGQRSSIPYRELPGIKQCGLWNYIRSQPGLPTFALVTDVGNDLLYGASPEQVVEWVTECVVALRTMDAKFVVTELPIDAILATTRLRFRIFRTIFFPPSQLTLEAACDMAQRTNELLRSMALSHGGDVHPMQPSWYGIDPIHIRRRYQNIAWQSVVNRWQLATLASKANVFPWKNRVRLQMTLPEERWFLGRHQTRVQPSITLVDGSTVAVF